MNSNPLIKTGLNYGSMSGLALVAMFFILYFAGFNPLGGMSWLGAWIPIVFITLAMKLVRDQLMGGFISFGMAFRIGLITVFFSSLLFDMIIFVFGKAVDPGIVEAYRSEILKSADAAKSLLSENMVDQVIEEAQKVNITSIVFNDFTTKMTGGIILCLILAAILMRKKPHEPSF